MNKSIPGARILIVEDSLGVARSLSLSLGLHHPDGYQVETCAMGEEALRHLLQSRFDLLITDLRLPGLDGITLLERARQLSPSTRTILITAFGSAEVEDRARELANAYLPKPFRLQQLVQLVERVLREPAPAAPAPAPPAMVALPPEQSRRRVEQRKAVHLTVLATDLDGTLTITEEIAPSAWDMLRQARMSGLVLILVTGRTLDSFIARGPFEELFEAIIAENGAVIYYPRREAVMLPFGRLDPGTVHQLHELKVPVDLGMAIAATVVPHDQALLRILRENRAGGTVEYNRSAVMLQPLGATKGAALLQALDELGYSPHNVVACGNAENDRSLFEVAELSVAVANAEPALRHGADSISDQPAGLAVESLLQDLIEGQVPPRRPRPERALLLGYRASGAPVNVDPFALIETNIGIFGSSGSGKSWLAGLLAEELLRQKYQVCIIDPEGDYRGLGNSPRTLLLGGPDSPLPPVADVLNLVEWNAVSVVLDLSTYGYQERVSYMDDFLRALRGLRARRGRPHYFLVDEVQSFCPPDDGALTGALLEAMAWGGFAVVSYRPSQVASAILDHLDHCLLTRLALPEEVETVHQRLLQHRDVLDVAEQLPNLAKGQAYLCLGAGHLGLPAAADLIRFRVGARAVPHIRHLHKYLRAPLPAHKRFYFTREDGQALGSAANLWEFREFLNRLPAESLRYHLERGDFARWFSEVLRDSELARRTTKIHNRELDGDALRETLLEVVANRYQELDAQM